MDAHGSTLPGLDFALEARCKIVNRVYGASRDAMLAWLNAARSGELKTMRRLQAHAAASEQAPRLVHLTGEGTSYGFIGSTALHWAAANGDTAMMRQLLEWGASPNAQNKGGSTPLHSACANLRVDSVALLLQHGANPLISDCCNDTPADLLTNADADTDVRRGGKTTKAASDVRARIRQLLDAQALASSLRDRSSGITAVDAKSMRALLVLSGAFARPEECPVELAALTSACRAALGAFSSRLERAASCDASFERLRSQLQDAEDAARDRDAAADDDDAATAAERSAEAAEQQMLHIKAQQTSAKGNDAFSRGDYRLAVQLYTTAISLAPRDATFHSNRSAAYMKLAVPARALADAKAAAALRPEWAKPYHRMGTAALALGQLDDAVAAFRIGLERAPGDPSLLAGLEAAAAARTERRAEPRVIDEEAAPSAKSAPPAATDAAFVPLEQRRPWFTCSLCDNRTRDAAESPCCAVRVCGTCARRRFGTARCPLGCASSK
jgi:tetratricopeptide (TPR) repeat protein